MIHNIFTIPEKMVGTIDNNVNYAFHYVAEENCFLLIHIDWKLCERKTAWKIPKTFSLTFHALLIRKFSNPTTFPSFQFLIFFSIMLLSSFWWKPLSFSHLPTTKITNIFQSNWKFNETNIFRLENVLVTMKIHRSLDQKNNKKKTKSGKCRIMNIWMLSDFWRPWKIYDILVLYIVRGMGHFIYIRSGLLLLSLFIEVKSRSNHFFCLWSKEVAVRIGKNCFFAWMKENPSEN